MAKKTKIIDEVYPNSPLVEVVFEIRFPDEPAIECRRDVFYDRIRDSYPNVLVPKVRPDVPPALDPYRFENIEKNAGMMLALNKFSYYSRSYPGYREFRKETMRLVEQFGEVFSLGKLNRTGWRYINIIPFTREDGNVPVARFFNLTVTGPKSLREEHRNLSIILVSKTNGGTITTKIESMMTADKSHEALLLDFDYGKEQNLRFQKIGRYIKESHESARALFEELITDSYRKYLRGETI